MAKTTKRKAKQKRKNIGIAVIAWLVLALAICVFFLINKDTIMSNVRAADVGRRLFGAKTEISQSSQFQKEQESDGQLDISEINNVAVAEDVVIPVQPQVSAPSTAEVVTDADRQHGTADLKGADASSSAATAAANEDSGNAANSSSSDSSVAGASGAAVASTVNKGAVPPAPVATTNVELCFIVIGTDGSVSRKFVKRALPKNSAPLTAALGALLSGPTADERASENCTSLIPANTRLLGASVRDGVAYLNFSDDFEINSVGADGYNAQMMQIVYTATNFSTVNSVQFLIDGERKEYLGSEGLWIGSPIGRASFR